MALNKPKFMHFKDLKGGRHNSAEVTTTKNIYPSEFSGRADPHYRALEYALTRHRNII